MARAMGSNLALSFLRKKSWSLRSSLLAASSLLFLVQCGGEFSEDEFPALFSQRAAEAAYGVALLNWQHLPVPPEDGPVLAPLALITPIVERPESGSSPIGYLRVGEKVPRSEEPVSFESCEGGWYAVRPVGFVCHNDNVTLKLDHPLVRAFPHGPERDKPLPYRYGFIRSVVPNYLKIPSRADQERYEMFLDRHLQSYAKHRSSWDELVPGANQVPLSPSGAGLGELPEDAQPLDMNRRYGGDGDDSVPWWLVGERRIPNISSFKAPPYAVIAGRTKRKAGVSLIGSFQTGEESLNRRFAITVDGRLIPADKIKADSGSTFHGEEIRELGLPIAFVFRPDSHSYSWEGNRRVRGEKLPHRKMIPLTGKVKNHQGERYVEARDGSWLRSSDLKTAAQPSSLPWFAKRGVRWIDISILSQILVLYEGPTPVYATLISTGRDGLGDPQKSLSTPTGTFRVYQKHVTTTMDSDVADDEFELRDVPWVMYYQGGYAIHAAYWHDDFGRPRSHGCINLAPIDARYVFNWSLPDVPEHWHAGYSSESLGQGTLVHVRP